MSTYPQLVNRLNNQVIEIDSKKFTVGRGLDCCHVLNNSFASRTHFIIEENNGTWMLRDKSSNGTFVNGRMITYLRTIYLEHGDCIEMTSSDESFKFLLRKLDLDSSLSDEQLCEVLDSVECVEKQPPIDVSEKVSVEVQCPVPAINEVKRNPEEGGNVGTCNTVESATSIPGTSSSSDVDNQRKRSSSPKKSESPEKKNKYDALPPGGNINKSKPSMNEPNKKAAEENINISKPSMNEPHKKPAEENINISKPSMNEPNKKPAEENINISKPSLNEQKKVENVGAINFDMAEQEMLCSICSEFFIKAVTLNCCHSFCKYCIEQWKRKQSDCPICRTKITVMAPTLVLDNFIERLVSQMDDESKESRKQAIEYRSSAEKTQNEGLPSTSKSRTTTRSSATTSASSSTTVTNNSSVTVISSDEELDDYTDDDDEEEYDYYHSNYYGGYGRCYNCHERGHWANTCPRRWR